MNSAYYELLKGIETRLKAGIPLRDSLEGLERDGRGALAALAGALRSQIEAGATLAQALGDLPASTPPAHAALIDAGESSGRLNETLADIIAEESILADARRRLQLRLAYPLLICCLAFLLPFLYLVFQGRIGEYLLIQACFFGPLGALLLLVFSRHRFFPRGSSQRLLFERIVLVVPFFGRLTQEYALAGSLQLLGRLLQAGLGYADGLPLVSEAAGLHRLALQFKEMAAGIADGASASEGLSRITGIPLELRSRLASGDVSGTIDQALVKSGAELREAALARLETVVKVLPILVYLLAAGLVLWRAVSVFSGLPGGF
ncbi:MAG: type II secretion system F family protein [Planctomycetota bacterium]